MLLSSLTFFFFFFNDTATTEIYTLSLHDALPILRVAIVHAPVALARVRRAPQDHEREDRSAETEGAVRDRKSTRLNSSHLVISYAVFCLKKKKKTQEMSRSSSNRNTAYYKPRCHI